MLYIKQNMCDSSKVYKFEHFKESQQPDVQQQLEVNLSLWSNN